MAKKNTEKIEAVPAKKKTSINKLQTNAFDAYNVVKFPVSTEKNVRLMEAENKLLFVVERRTTKSDVKRAIEVMFKVKVVKVNTYFGADGQKRAYVTFSAETPAIDVATNLGLI